MFHKNETQNPRGQNESGIHHFLAAQTICVYDKEK